MSASPHIGSLSGMHLAAGSDPATSEALLADVCTMQIPLGRRMQSLLFPPLLMTHKLLCGSLWAMQSVVRSLLCLCCSHEHGSQPGARYIYGKLPPPAPINLHHYSDSPFTASLPLSLCFQSSNHSLFCALSNCLTFFYRTQQL